MVVDFNFPVTADAFEVMPLGGECGGKGVASIYRIEATPFPPHSPPKGVTSEALLNRYKTNLRFETLFSKYHLPPRHLPPKVGTRGFLRQPGGAAAGVAGIGKGGQNGPPFARKTEAFALPGHCAGQGRPRAVLRFVRQILGGGQPALGDGGRGRPNARFTK